LLPAIAIPVERYYPKMTETGETLLRCFGQQRTTLPDAQD